MDQSILTRNAGSKKALETKETRVNDDVLQHGVALAMWLNNDKPHW